MSGTHNNPEACAAREMFATTHWSVVLLAHEQVAKRGGRNAVISLDEAAGESRFGLEVADHVTPETLRCQTGDGVGRGIVSPSSEDLERVSSFALSLIV